MSSVLPFNSCQSVLRMGREMNFLIILLFSVFNLVFSVSNGSPPGNLQYLYTKVKPELQATAATDVLQRLFPNRYNEFRIEINRQLSPSPYEDSFKINWDNEKNQIVASGTTAVSALYGLNYYLKYYCNIHVSWEGSQLALPEVLPKVTIGGTILDRFRYFANTCTESYTFAWWNWTQWEKHIDWLALSGINFPLAFTGQELIWERLYLSLGLSQEEVEDYISGPAFLAWWRMGNMQKWGGPSPRKYITEKLKLQHQILDRMRSLGMLPILPAFAGHVPPTLPKLFPNSTFIRHPRWAGFNTTYSATYMLEPSDPLFIEIGKKFNLELVTEFGTDHVYNADTFNENQPSSSDPTFLRTSSKSTFKSMLANDPKAVWVLQGWFFHFEPSFWTKEAVQSYLSGVQIGNLIILDLYAEMTPLYKRFDSFYNHTFLWCMLQNFGGLVNLYGSMDKINEGLYEARQAALNGSSMIGVGMTMEGINQNFVVYDFMSELSLASSPLDVDGWIQRYAQRRYGVSNELLQDSWTILGSGVYKAPSWVWVRNAAVMLCRPDEDLKEVIWYPMNNTEFVVRYFIEAAEDTNVTNSALFRHDLVDFTRQFVQHMGFLAYGNMMGHYKANRTDKFQRSSQYFLATFDDLEMVLKTNPWFVLGEWTKAAESWGTTEEEKKLLRFNSLNQITLWGPNGEIMDYAAKQWSGMISGYYKQRWALFVSYLNNSLTMQVPLNKTAFSEEVLNEVEIPFTKTTSMSEIFSTELAGDSIAECIRVYKKWKTTFLRMARKYTFKVPKSCTNPDRVDKRCLVNKVPKLVNY